MNKTTMDDLLIQIHRLEMKIAQMKDEGLDYTNTYKLYEQYLEEYNSEVVKYNSAIEKAKEEKAKEEREKEEQAKRAKEEEEKRAKEEREGTKTMVIFFVGLFALVTLIVFLAAYNNGCI